MNFTITQPLVNYVWQSKWISLFDVEEYERDREPQDNEPFETYFHIEVELRQSRNRGLGLFSKVDLPKNFLMPYPGLVLTAQFGRYLLINNLTEFIMENSYDNQQQVTSYIDASPTSFYHYTNYFLFADATRTDTIAWANAYINYPDEDEEPNARFLNIEKDSDLYQEMHALRYPMLSRDCLTIIQLTRAVNANEEILAHYDPTRYESTTEGDEHEVGDEEGLDYNSSYDDDEFEMKVVA